MDLEKLFHEQNEKEKAYFAIPNEYNKENLKESEHKPSLSNYNKFEFKQNIKIMKQVSSESKEQEAESKILGDENKKNENKDLKYEVCIKLIKILSKKLLEEPVLLNKLVLIAKTWQDCRYTLNHDYLLFISLVLYQINSITLSMEKKKDSNRETSVTKFYSLFTNVNKVDLENFVLTQDVILFSSTNWKENAFKKIQEELSLNRIISIVFLNFSPKDKHIENSTDGKVAKEKATEQHLEDTQIISVSSTNDLASETEETGIKFDKEFTSFEDMFGLFETRDDEVPFNSTQSLDIFLSLEVSEREVLASLQVSTQELDSIDTKIRRIRELFAENLRNATMETLESPEIDVQEHKNNLVFSTYTRLSKEKIALNSLKKLGKFKKQRRELIDYEIKSAKEDVKKYIQNINNFYVKQCTIQFVDMHDKLEFIKNEFNDQLRCLEKERDDKFEKYLGNYIDSSVALMKQLRAGLQKTQPTEEVIEITMFTDIKALKSSFRKDSLSKTFTKHFYPASLESFTSIEEESFNRYDILANSSFQKEIICFFLTCDSLVSNEKSFDKIHKDKIKILLKDNEKSVDVKVANFLSSIEQACENLVSKLVSEKNFC